MHEVRVAVLAVLLCLGSVAGGCSQVQGMLNEPFVGAVDGCRPRIEAALCRRIAETAIRAIPGPAVAADSLSVATWDSCRNDDVVEVAPAAVDGATCYSVFGSGYAGGERLGGGAYRNGTRIMVNAVVWADAEGALRAVVRTEEVSLEP